MIVATAGHVDHGKTTLLRALTGIDTMHLPEERRRNMTIDLGFAAMADSDGGFVYFIDVPGHERFIRNMLAGLAGIDLAMLVVAADDGIMPQTREHAEIIDLLGVPAGIVVITKIDRVPGKRVAAVIRSIANETKGTCLAGAPVFPVDAVRGPGIDALRDELVLRSTRPARPRPGTHFRLPIDRSFVVDGVGHVVAGTVAAGRTAVGDRLILLPANLPVRVRGLHTHHREVKACGAGHRLALNITAPDLDRDCVRRGAWLVDRDIATTTDRFDLHYTVATGVRLRREGRVHLCHGTINVGGRLHLLQGGADIAGDRGFAQLVLDAPTHLLVGDRLVLRDAADRRNLAGGIVLDPLPPLRGRRHPDRLRLLGSYLRRDAGAALLVTLAASSDGVDLRQFAQSWNMPLSEIEAIGKAGGMMLSIAAAQVRGFDGSTWRACETEILVAVDKGEAVEAAGSAPAAARRRPASDARRSTLTSAVWNHLLQSGVLVRRGQRMVRSGASTEPSAEERRQWSAAAQFLRLDDGPLKVAEIATRLCLRQTAVELLLKNAARLGEAVQVAPDRYLLTADVVNLAATMETVADRNGTFGLTEFRSQATVGRNLSIVLLEYFDRIGFTRRVGDRRRIVRSTDSLFKSDGGLKSSTASR